MFFGIHNPKSCYELLLVASHCHFDDFDVNTIVASTADPIGLGASNTKEEKEEEEEEEDD